MIKKVTSLRLKYIYIHYFVISKLWSVRQRSIYIYFINLLWEINFLLFRKVALPKRHHLFTFFLRRLTMCNSMKYEKFDSVPNILWVTDITLRRILYAPKQTIAQAMVLVTLNNKVSLHKNYRSDVSQTLPTQHLKLQNLLARNYSTSISKVLFVILNRQIDAETELPLFPTAPRK